MKRTKPINGQNLPTERKKPGPKGKYQPWMAEDAADLIGKLGARNSDLAEYFEVDETTIDYWIRNREDFRRAVRRGRLESGLRVSQALYQKAVGATYIDSQVFMETIKEYYENGKLKNSITQPKVIRVQKQLPPDAYAAHKFLSVLFREQWADTQKHQVEHTHSGEVTHKHLEELSLENLPPEVKNFIFELNLAQLGEGQKN